jgi:hypothetical protein
MFKITSEYVEINEKSYKEIKKYYFIIFLVAEIETIWDY